MYFLIDETLKIIFGWSPKCGCSHIKKIFWYLKTNNNDSIIHIPSEYNYLPNNIEEYITILIVRNPYDRLISGFLDKYKENGEHRHLWKHGTITFSTFVDELVKNDWLMIDYHHFTPQTTEYFDKDIIYKSKILKVYDLNNIDYNYIENLYNKKIPDNLLQFRGGHERNIYSETFENFVYDLDMSTYYNYNMNIKYFFNDILWKKVYDYYYNDFMFFRECEVYY